MFAAMVLTALVVSSPRSGSCPRRARRSSRSRARHRAQLHAALNIVLTLVGAALLWLTVRRGFTDPVCGMRVDRYQIPHRSQWHGRPVFFCSAGCQESFDADPDTYTDKVARDAGRAHARPAQGRHDERVAASPCRR
jgi:YHS domain-containing protein